MERYTSNSVAAHLNTDHRVLLQRVYKYFPDIERVYEKRPSTGKAKGTQTHSFVYLTKEQVEALSKDARGRYQAIESETSIRIAKELGAKREVKTPAGNIDILSSTELIEVKYKKQWKAAIGQALAYSTFYPTHTLRIHLIEDNAPIEMDMVRSICKGLGIKVTIA